ncbi:hypothetical protein JD276_00910 [Leucobacter sp. CSA1]|uniref:Fibronectin type-III domain-containing protein n=1 Tax=Leucobacter chromiisoli TaxID=2796471 RepID=A0A934Q670_9MICO|nr:hypothetical protein [Leucobacter chromiisoli]
MIATIAVVASGYDARETPREEASVWTVRSSGQYARVNTETGEIDTVRRIDNPSGLVQSSSGGVLLSNGNGQAWTIDPRLPGDLVAETDGAGGDAVGGAPGAPDDAAGGSAVDGTVADPTVDAPGPAAGDEGPGAMRTPEGTRDVVSAGGVVVFRTESGSVYLSRFETGDGTSGAGPGLTEPLLLDPLEAQRGDEAAETAEPDASGEAEGADEGDGADGPQPGGPYRADAVAVDDAGLVALFSSEERAVRWFDATAEGGAGAFVGGASETPDVPADGIQLAGVAGEWVLLDAESGRVWIEGREETVELDTAGGARLQASSAGTGGGAPRALIADSTGLWAVGKSGSAERIAEAEGLPAQPVAVGDRMHAAWIGPSGGTLWSSGEDGAGGETLPLELDDTVEDMGEFEPVIRSNGSRAVVAETRTGMMWTVPDGRLIPVEQWTLVDPPKQEQGTVVVQDVTEQEPPVAMDDAFGVRPGEPAPLPVLLNDYDPNRRDALTIVPEELGAGLPAEFGAVEMLADGQGLTVTPTASATGTASFSYRITDGTAVSEPATVTLTAVADDVDTAPEWCPVEGCQRAWPSPEITPGGTLVLPILEGWVDPEGDPMMLVSATPVDPADPVRALVTSDGRFALRHTDPNAGEGEVSVVIAVRDARGETRERELHVRVRAGALMELSPIASTVATNETTTLRPLGRVSGGSGSYALVDAVAQDGALDARVNQGAGTIEVTASEPGSTVLTVTVRDTGTEAETTGTLRVTAVDSRPPLGLPPLRAFVRPLSDTTVEVLDAIPGANGRSLVVRSASVVDGEMRADVIDHSRIRVSGSTPDGAPGRIGAAEVVVAEEGATSQGRLTVFQVPENADGGVIAVADTATVRAGSVVDIAVLDNDVSEPGERLVLHPEIGAPGTKGELAFASGKTLRYLAPAEPGTYTLSYTAYGASSPESGDVGHVRVTVLPKDGNRDPQPASVTVRLAPGEQATAQVPLSGVDPDGDRVRLVGVDSPDDPKLSATLAPRSDSVQVEAGRSAEPGTSLVDYTVRDGFGGEGRGRLRIIVTEASDGGGAPVAYSDYVRLARGVAEPAVVRPLDNDVDPARGELELVEVVPNVPGGQSSDRYRELAGRLDLSRMQQGRVLVAGGDDPGTVSYRYTVRSSESSSTSDGLIVVQVSDRVGQQAPTVRDTVLSARDRAELARGGVDVVTDRVHWASGDVSSLQLSLWGSAADRYSVDGSRIVGSYRAEGDLVPFRLAGTDAMGAEVESFGFLVVPPLDELRLTLQPGLAPISVDEDRSAQVDVADVLDLAVGDRVELREGPFPVQRSQASCSATGAGALRYTAGKEAPWTDSCVISVRLTEQRAWTQLALPIQIVPREPVVELAGVTRTVAPGEAQTVDLADMVRWQGGREGRAGTLSFSISGGARSFEVAQSGASLQVRARADAAPGAQEAVTVSVTGAGESRAPLTLRVGQAPRDTPRGATVALQCTVGSDCSARVIGAPGEHDPFSGKTGGGLELTGVDGGGCRFGTFRASGDSVSVGWPDPRGPGGRCTASFTVRDAQGRTGTGSIELDAQGVPRPPASIAAVGYTANSVTLEVQLSGQPAHPDVTGVRIEGGPGSEDCSASGATYRCTVRGLTPGEKHGFRARAVNAVGASDPTANSVTAWAYKTPDAPSVDPTQISAESTSTGTVRFEIRGGDDTSGFRIVTAAGERRANGRSATVDVAGLPVGASEYTVVPVSRHDPPSGAPSEGAGRSGSVRVGGLPSVSVSASSPAGGNRVDVTVNVNANGGGEVSHGFRVGSGNCSPAQHDGTSGSYSDTGEKYTTETVTACARNEWGTAQPAQTTVNVGGTPPAPTVNAGWTVAANPLTVPGSSAEYRYVSGPSVIAEPGLKLEYVVDGTNVGQNFPQLGPEREHTATVRQCTAKGVCSEPVAVTGNAPSPVTVDLQGCIASDASQADLLSRVSAGARSSASPSWDHAAGVLTIAWTGSYAALQPLSAPVCAQPDPNPEPPPGP